MTDEPGSLAPEAVRGPDRPRPRPIGPEMVGAVLAALVVVVIGGGALASGSTPVAPSTVPAPTPSSSVGPRPTPGVDRAAIAICLEINGRLATDRAALQAEVAASTFEPSNVAIILRGLNADVIVASDAAARLERLPATATVGLRLSTFYEDLHHQVGDALDNSVKNAPAYRKAATATITTLEALPALNALLDELRDEQPSPPSSAPVTSPSPAGPSLPPSLPPSPPPSPRPSGVGPTPSISLPPPSVPVGLQNAGFEIGVGAPWELSLSASGAATLQADSTVHAGGASSARVDITVPGIERTAVAVRQGGQPVAAGSHYLASIAVRAEATREVRLRIASAGGDTYATRLFTVGPEWQVITVDSTVLTTDTSAYLEVDLGRFAVTTWLDDASFNQVAVTGG